MTTNMSFLTYGCAAALDQHTLGIHMFHTVSNDKHKNSPEYITE